MYTVSQFLIVALAISAIDCQSPAIITVDNGETQGEWGPLETCPAGSRAVKYQTLNELQRPVSDETALNSIILTCNDPDQTNITSTQGYAGTLQQIQSCLLGSYLTSFQLRVSPAGNTTDDTAVNNIGFTCSNGRQISGVGNNGGYWGDYSDACVDGICGLETRVQLPRGGLVTDLTALNDVRFTCCSNNVERLDDDELFE